MLWTPRDVMLSWQRSTGLNNGPRKKRRRLESASNVFYCTFTKQQEYKSQSTDVFFLCFFVSFCCWKKYIMQIYISQLQQTVPPMRAERERAEGSWRAYNHTLQPVSPPQMWGENNNKKKKQGNILAESTISTGFGLSWPPQPPQQTRFVLHYGL